MKIETATLLQEAEEARAKLNAGVIDYDKALLLCQPYIDEVNKVAKKRSREYGVTFKTVTARGFLR